MIQLEHATKTLVHQSSYHLPSTASTFLEELFFWTTKDVGKVVDGFKFVYNTLENWVIRLRKVCRCTLWRNIKKLRQSGIVLFEQFNKHSYDRTGYYAINWERLERVTKEFFEQAIETGKLEGLILRGFPLDNMREFESDIRDAIESICNKGKKKYLMLQNMELPEWVSSMVKDYKETQAESKLDYKKPLEEKIMLREKVDDPFMGSNSPRYKSMQSRRSPISEIPDGPWMDYSQDENGRTHRVINGTFHSWVVNDFITKYGDTKQGAQANALLMYTNNSEKLINYWNVYRASCQEWALNVKARIDGGGTISETEKERFIKNANAFLPLDKEFQVVAPDPDIPVVEFSSLQEFEDKFVCPEKKVEALPVLDELPILTSAVEVEMESDVVPHIVSPHAEHNLSVIADEVVESGTTEDFTVASVADKELERIARMRVEQRQAQEEQVSPNHALFLLKMYLDNGLISQAEYELKVAELNPDRTPQFDPLDAIEEIIKLPVREDYQELTRVNKLIAQMDGTHRNLLSRIVAEKYPNYIHLLENGTLKEIYPPNYGESLMELPLDPDYKELPRINDFLSNCPKLCKFLCEKLPNKYRKYRLNYTGKTLVSIEAPEF